MSYKSKLSVFETQRAIKLIKDAFENAVIKKLNLVQISPPLLMETGSGLDDEVYVDQCVTFDLKAGFKASVVISLAKWKILALKKYGFGVNEGLYADMNSIRKFEDIGPLHSCYIYQWTWEKIIREDDRNMGFVKSIVKDVYECFKNTETQLLKVYPDLRKKLPEDIKFVSTQQLEDEYPELSAKEREYRCTVKHGAVFLMQVGKRLRSGKVHERRSADTEDWELNGDILVYYDVLDIALELSSMGVSVTGDSLKKQLSENEQLDRLDMPYHKAMASNELPFTVGGGIGQSRLCMYLLDKRHIGEVQASVWDQKNIEECERNNIKLL